MYRPHKLKIIHVIILYIVSYNVYLPHKLKSNKQYYYNLRPLPPKKTFAPLSVYGFPMMTITKVMLLAMCLISFQQLH